MKYVRFWTPSVISMPMKPDVFFLAFLLFATASCSKNTYPCPDIQGGNEVVKAGSPESMKAPEMDMDANGRLSKKPYSHAGVKKKKKKWW